jgi:hypothetical protein
MRVIRRFFAPEEPRTGGLAVQVAWIAHLLLQLIVLSLFKGGSHFDQFEIAEPPFRDKQSIDGSVPAALAGMGFVS